jgi:nitrite reductase/ring-hydroxylating ferredoxin subunit
MDFVEVCAMQQVQSDIQRAVRIGTIDIVLFNGAGALHAVENSCMPAPR